MFCYPPTPPRFARVKVREDEVRTQNNLAFDVKDMDELRKRGVPISNQSIAEMFYDGVDMGDTDNFELSPEANRFADINDVWNVSKDCGDIITKAKLKSVGSPVK